MLNKLKKLSLTMKIFIGCFCLILSKETIFEPTIIGDEHSLAERILLIGTMIIAVALRGAACMQIMGLIFEPYLLRTQLQVKATKGESKFFDTLVVLLLIVWCMAYYFHGLNYLKFVFKVLGCYFLIRVISILQTKAVRAIQGEKTEPIHGEWAKELEGK